MRTLVEQLRCVEREIKMRERAYPRFVEQGRMTEQQAARELATMRDVAETLRGMATPRLEL